jgi:S1-C subfamily serine protease
MKQVFVDDGPVVQAPNEGLGSGGSKGPLPQRAKRRWTRALVVAIVLSGALLAAGLVFVVRDEPQAQSAGTQAPALHQDTQPIQSSPTVRMIKGVLPSVVNIRTTAVAVNPFGGPSPMKAEGSGVVIDRGGVILTNNHVIANALKVKVLFNDDEHDAMQGTVVGADPEHDLAVVKVDANDLHPIALGDSGTLELGESAVAIGFPLGLGGPTVTKGIVSGLDRTIEPQAETTGVEHLGGIIQTDAAINPGNSGGALVDSAGRLIGIITAAASAASAENVGFAIPVDEAVPVARHMLTEPSQRRAWLGVETSSLTSDLEALQLSLPPGTRGAVIVGVIPGSPAASAGLQPGDVIMKLNDETIDSSPSLTEAIADLSPGDTIHLEVRNSEGVRSTAVRVSTRPETFATPSG